MALQAVLGTSTPNGDLDIGTKFVYVFGTITTSGNYVTSGEALDFTAITKTFGSLGIPATKGGVIPLPTYVSIQGQNAAGNTYQYVPGTTAANGKVIGRTAAGTQFTNGAAYPTDTIIFQAAFPRF